MGSKVNFKDLIKLQKQLEKSQKEIPKLMEDIAKDIATEFLHDVIERTPQNANTLKQGWQKNDLQVIKQGSNYLVTIKNDVEYASLVEYGHKSENGKSWVNGRFMMTITEQEIEQKMNGIAEPKLNEFLEGVFK